MVIDKDIVTNLYKDKGLSAKEIGNKLGLTVWQVIKFMRKNNIARRRQSETRRLQFLRSPLSFKKKVDLTQNEKNLNIVGHMLYWAEGSKKGKHTVDFANSDLGMNKLFLKMLRQIYQVDEKRLRILVYCYANQNSQGLVNFWSKKLRISTKQFSRPYIRKDFNVEKKNLMRYGLVHIRYNDMRLIEKIKNEIDIIQRDI